MQLLKKRTKLYVEYEKDIIEFVDVVQHTCFHKL